MSAHLCSCMLLTCSHQGQASESQPDMCHTSPRSRQLDTHTFPLHHTADSTNLGETADKLCRGKKEFFCLEASESIKVISKIHEKDQCIINGLSKQR